MFSRQEFCALLKISSDDLKNLTRRGHMPFRGEDSRRGEYSLYETILALMAQHLSLPEELGSPVRAASVVAHIAPELWEHGDRIRDTSQDLFDGVQPEEILAAVFKVPYPDQPTVACGTLREISDALMADGRPIVSATITNVSRAACVLRIRAMRSDIAIESNYWLMKPVTVAAAFDPAGNYGWDDVVEKANARTRGEGRQ